MSTLLTPEELWVAVNEGKLKMHYKAYDLAVASIQLRKVISEIEALGVLEELDIEMRDFGYSVAQWLEAVKKEIG